MERKLTIVESIRVLLVWGFISLDSAATIICKSQFFWSDPILLVTTHRYSDSFPMASKIFLLSLTEVLTITFFSGKPFDMNNMMNPTGKEFEQKNSAVLALIMEDTQKIWKIEAIL